MQCSVCKAENSGDAVFCQRCGARLARKPPVEVEMADSSNEPEVRVRARPAGRSPEMEESGGEPGASRPRRRRLDVEEENRPAGGAIVPYRNPLALFGYYSVFLGFIIAIGAVTGVLFFFSQTVLQPKHIRFAKTVVYIGLIVGMIFELAAFLLGVFGLLYVRTHPTARGTGHAILSVVLGPLLLIVELVALILIIAWLNSVPQS
jgi:hypothetical protein